MNTKSNWFKILSGTLLLCILGPLSITMKGYVPITLQSLGVVLVPIIFGWKNGLISIAAYLLAGAFGAPVFAEFKSGIEVFKGSTAGFLFGFLPAGFVAGYYSDELKVQYGRYFFLFIGAQLVLLLCGLIGLLVSGVDFSGLWRTVLVLFPGLMIKSFFGAFVVLAVKMKKT